MVCILRMCLQAASLLLRWQPSAGKAYALHAKAVQSSSAQKVRMRHGRLWLRTFMRPSVHWSCTSLHVLSRLIHAHFLAFI